MKDIQDFIFQAETDREVLSQMSQGKYLPTIDDLLVQKIYPYINNYNPSNYRFERT